MPVINAISHSLTAIRKARSQKRINGFTLIELLVVIAIIGILATFIVASFNSAQQRGRDARRKSDLDAVKKALELAKNDCTGSKWYPLAAGVTEEARYSGGGNSLDGFLDSGTLNYIRALPHDPKFVSASADDYHYTPYTPVGPSGASVCLDGTGARTLGGVTRYTLSALLENGNDPGAAESATRCEVAGATDAVPRSGVFPTGTVPYYVCSD